MATTQPGGYYLDSDGNPKDASGEPVEEQEASEGEINATDGAKELAEEEDVDLANVDGTGSDGRITKSDVKEVV